MAKIAIHPKAAVHPVTGRHKTRRRVAGPQTQQIGVRRYLLDPTSLAGAPTTIGAPPAAALWPLPGDFTGTQQ